jgi:hypothetical protein
MLSHARNHHCALARANRVLGTVGIKPGAWVFTRSSIARGYAFHPRAIDDPRGRILVRATSQLQILIPASLM